MIGLFLLIMAWVVAAVFTHITEFTYFESFVIVTLGAIFAKAMRGDAK